MLYQSVGHRRINIPHEIWVLISITALLSLVSPNPGPTLLGALLLPVLFKLLWRVGEPPALLFAVGFQWLQVFSPVLTANFGGEVMGSDPAVPQLGNAAYLGLIAMFFLALGMRFGRGGRPLDPSRAAIHEVQQLGVKALLFAYVLTQGVDAIVGAIGLAAPGLYQPLLPLQLLRWVVVFVILRAGFQEKRFRKLAIFVVLFEIFLGMLGFFASFKFVLFLAIVVSLSMTVNPRRLLRPRVLMIGVVVILMSSAWQSIKTDYRGFLNQGTSTQAVLVSPEARIEFLIDRVESLSWADLQQGLQSGAERTGYLEFFARSMSMVPDRIPYQYGELWGEVFIRVLMPRLFFPDKTAVDDSDRTNKFSGLRVATAAEGASIGLGYVAESYIDFGPALMFVPIFLLGIFWGWCYRLLVTTGRYRLLGFGMATSFILGNAMLFESSNIKIVGGGIIALIVGGAFLKYGSVRAWKFLTRRSVRRAGFR